MKRVLVVLAAVAVLGGCESDANRAAQNLSTAADNFEINRRIVFYNGITGGYMLTIEGLCSKDSTSSERKLSITCKVGAGTFKRHMLGLSDNVTYFIEQVEPVAASTYHYRVIFKPANIVPDLEVK